ncbi:RpiB/LacA/LacB family sugar-phosphate isomerase [Streptomyces cocklensis]|uniref:Ribose 5-phosphate isomerase B n=1 Tax=Actinacidiphila cocklensis TaxID=887465 RepID=A0A9W4E6N4_9ACTN|nr:RpiB/LacA/LacB family sugar-phosphate isomerase [Actinacidiphila cocklensis]MDD1062805.1 RpiB/LacA/LacB family sugar-phosphate isomerase [Actinacidiphila cocklensis]CAG6394056.1 Ribose 5-phosphate isomerase B [Actinacidiphila cocklensis]
MRIAVSSDMDEPIARQAVEELRRRGHTVQVFGALRDGDRADWAWSAEAAARAVASGAADQAVVCCWTGAGASMAANKVPGVRAALCGDAYSARGARVWSDANALALSLRLLSGGLLAEILDAWFAAGADQDRDAEDRANIAHLGAIESAPSPESAPSAQNAPPSENAPAAGVSAVSASERA